MRKPVPLVCVAVCALLAATFLPTLATGRRIRDLGKKLSTKTVDDYANAYTGTFDSSKEKLFSEALLPRFAEGIPNVTVTVGKDALLACVVENLRSYKVAWVRVDTQTILSIHHNVITQNPRISLSHNDHRSWYLHINNVHEADRGWYMCQINTDPMRSRVGYIQVVVPPSIIDRETSSDMVVREGTNVSMTCKAEGYPDPYVMWRREDGEDINYNGVEVNVVDGELLHITRVSRLHMGAYLCIASNGVPPSISKRVLLRVQFPPMLSIPNQLEGAYIGQDVALECHTEAYPSSINYWTTERGDMIVSGDKYEAVSVDNSYKKYMMLKIRNVSKKDFGSYKCVAKNSLGETDGVIKLDEIPAPSTSSTTSTTPAAPGGGKKRGRGSKNWKQRHHGDTTLRNNEVIHAAGSAATSSWGLDGEQEGEDDSDLDIPAVVLAMDTTSTASKRRTISLGILVSLLLLGQL